MKGNKKCPKCNSIDIIRVNGSVGSYGSGNHISSGFWAKPIANVNRYICCNCGFCEEWIDKEDLSKLKNNKNLKT